MSNAIIPRAHMPKDSTEYAERTVGYFKRLWKSLDTDFERIDQVLNEIDDSKAWEKYPTDKPYGSLDLLLLAEIGESEQSVRSKIQSRKRKRATVEAAKANPEAARDKPGNPTGVNQHTERNGVEDEKQHNSSTKGHGSTNVPYRLKVLRRDHPDIAARLDAGEFDSVAEAERVARGKPAKLPRKKSGPLDILRKAWQKATKEERDTFLSEISPN